MKIILLNGVEVQLNFDKDQYADQEEWSCTAVLVLKEIEITVVSSYSSSKKEAITDACLNLKHRIHQAANGDYVRALEKRLAEAEKEQEKCLQLLTEHENFLDDKTIVYEHLFTHPNLNQKE